MPFQMAPETNYWLHRTSPDTNCRSRLVQHHCYHHHCSRLCRTALTVIAVEIVTRMGKCQFFTSASGCYCLKPFMCPSPVACNVMKTYQISCLYNTSKELVSGPVVTPIPTTLHHRHLKKWHSTLLDTLEQLIVQWLFKAIQNFTFSTCFCTILL